MGDAVDPPAAVTHFGQENVEASGTTIDLVAAEDLPPAESLKNDDDWVYPFPTDFKIQEKPIDDIRHLKVAVIGAGIAGITAGVLLPRKVPGIQLTIFDKNSDVGGTWLENIYPGVRCDIPSHCYQSTYAPKVNWSEEYAQGQEIKDYWQSIAKKFDVYSKCRFQTKVNSAQWNPEKAKWSLNISDIAKSTTDDLDFDFIITANGHFNEWKLPSYPGIEKFKGHLRHSSNWDPSFNPKGKRIATIGNGASGIQVTTALQKQAAHVDHYARNKTWIAGSFNPSARERQEAAMPFTEEQIRDFQDPEKYLAFRKHLEGTFFRRFESILRDSETTRKGTEAFKKIMRERLGDDAELLEKMVPDFPPFCRRLTPGPGYLEAITKDNLTFIQDPIDHFTEDGIVTKDGVHRPVDAIICSTGANVDFAPPFPLIAGDYDLSRDWKPDGKFGFPYSYLGIGTPHFPNLAYILGPHPPGTSGTVPHGAEVQTTFIAKLLRKISTQGIRTATPSKRATDDFVAYCDAFFPRTNMSRKCSSWYNGGRPGARIHGVWPGSASHLTRVLREPKWEDFEYTYETGENRFGFLGNGWTAKEQDPEADLTPWLRLEGQNDLKDLHERWQDL